MDPNGIMNSCNDNPSLFVIKRVLLHVNG